MEVPLPEMGWLWEELASGRGTISSFLEMLGEGNKELHVSLKYMREA